MTESPFDSHFPPLSASPTSLQTESGAVSRRAFLALSAVAGAAALTLPALPARALELKLQMPTELKFLENAQFLQYQFFSRALIAPSLADLTPQNNAALAVIAREDGEQARWFRAVRQRRGLMPMTGTQPASLTAPTFVIDASHFAAPTAFYDSAIALKNAVIGAYHGIVGDGGDPDTIQALAALAGVQNRHVAMLNEMAGRDPFVVYVDAMSLQDAGNALSKFGFGTEVIR